MTRVLQRLAILALLLARPLHAEDTNQVDSTNAWHAQRASLMTRWAEKVSPTNDHPEYPRPQMVRTEWLNLNGLWDYAVKPMAAEQPDIYDGKILVPFPIESALSGVMKPLDDKSALWYRRTVRIPAEWRGRRVRLQFGAVDWACRVFVNGREAGQHRGGYDRFAFDITDDLHWTREEEIVVVATDPTEGDQPRGKQSRNPEGIFYTSTSGIWQTVWLEPVNDVCIDELKMVPDVETNALRLSVAVNSLADDLTVEAVAFDGKKIASQISGQGNTELILPIANPQLWSPGSPFLYDLTVTLKRGGKELDQVTSYFGMRTVGLVPNEKGLPQIGLNGKPLFELGTLDQGFWPDGIYTAPTDEALRSDIEFLKQAGFNMARKHVKIEPDRWYYWCDKLGLLVWQDMPSANNATPEGQQEFESELIHMVKDLDNHPSIILWILFNEGWGQHDTQRLTQRLQALDPSRLVDSASGWTDAKTGDIVDIHDYPGPNAPEPEPRRAGVLGEFGGLGLITEGHSWASNRHWSYRMESNSAALAVDYQKLLREVWSLHDIQSLSAAVFTQTADVETECNGLMTYDRKVRKISAKDLAKANFTAVHLTLTRVILPDALGAAVKWKYTFNTPEGEWFAPDFSPVGWREGQAGFGTPRTPSAVIGTIWDTADIWLRRDFVLGGEDLRGLKLEIHHDEDAEVYLNGVLATRLPGYIDHYDQFEIRPEAIAALHPGKNTIAAHCHQTTGGQYIDVGLVAPAMTSRTNAPDGPNPDGKKGAPQ
jgi:hypothetical protein